MHTFVQKSKAKAVQQTSPAKSTISGRAHFRQDRENSMLQLQRTLGNQAIQRMLQPNAEELEVGLASTASPRFAHDFSQIPLHSMSPANVQAKLMTVGQPKFISWKTIIAWIQQYVPCFVGEIPHEWTDKVIRELRNQQVPDAVIASVLRYLRGQGFRFAVTLTSAQIGYNLEYQAPRPVNESRMGPAPKEPMDLVTAQHWAGRFENDFLKAQSAGNVADMEAAAGALLNLLWQYLKFKAKVKGEKDKIDQVAEEVLRNSPNMRRIVRNLGPGELARLREAPSPPNPRNLRFHIPPRTVRPPRAR